MIDVLFSKQEMDEETYHAYQDRIASIVFCDDQGLRDERLFNLNNDCMEVFKKSYLRDMVIESAAYLQGRSNEDLQKVRELIRC